MFFSIKNMKRTELDYDSDPLYRQVKENYQEKIRKTELKEATADSIVDEMDISSEKNVDNQIKWIEAMVCKNSDHPDKIKVSVQITTPNSSLKVLSTLLNGRLKDAMLENKIDIATNKFRNTVLKKWNELHPLIEGILYNDQILVQIKK